MSFRRIYEGWDVPGRLGDRVKRSVASFGRTREAETVGQLADKLAAKLCEHGLDDDNGVRRLAEHLAEHVLEEVAREEVELALLPLYSCLADCVHRLIEYEGLFWSPDAPKSGGPPNRSELWEVEDQLKRTGKILDNLDEALGDIALLVGELISPLIAACPGLIEPTNDDARGIAFSTPVLHMLPDLPETVERMVQLPFAPEFETYDLTPNLKSRLKYNLIVASGGNLNDPRALERARLPTKSPATSPEKLVEGYLGETPFAPLFDLSVPLIIPEEARFEHHHIVAGSGHGKTQTLQQLILHDLDAVADGKASVVVIDSQSDLLGNIAGLEMFAPGSPLGDRLCIIDPTDVEWPVALNLFDAGMDRIKQYSQLDRERLINGILELYDFVLGSLLDAGMTQKQSVIFRYITRLLLHIPNATIHTLRELLEDEGYAKHRAHIEKLEGTARAFFETEFQSKEFVQTRKQVLRRLYGILENQSFERMFSHPKSKLDLFSEMNAGRVILINTAKDLLKENGTQIFGRFFIAMIAQAAQERAVIEREERLPTFVYIDEANDYFDRNIGIILSQARKYNIGMVLAHQFLGQLDTKLQEAISANTSIKFVGGLSAKDARAMASDLRTDPGFIEEQDKLSFAAYVKGATKKAVSVSITPCEMEALPRMSAEDKQTQRQTMRSKYAVHYTEARIASSHDDEPQHDEDEDIPTAWE